MASLRQKLDGQIEPADLDWKGASSADRRAFYERAGEVALERLRTQLGRGIGANGRAMKLRIRAVLPDGADGPVMEPHYDASRVIRLSKYSATDRGLTLWWHAGTGNRKPAKKAGKKKGKGKKSVPFGQILTYHAEGMVPHAPVRDVRLSRASINQIKLEMRTWWDARRKKVKKKAAMKPVKPPGPPPLKKIPAGRGPFVVETAAFKTILPPKKPPPVKPVPPPPPPVLPTPIERAASLAAEHGIKVDPAGHDLLKYRFPPEELEHIPAAFFPGPNARILINEKSAAWGKMDEMLQKATAQRWWSSGHVDQVIQHEIGHALHHQAVGYEEFAAAAKGTLDATGRGLAADRVSRYSATNPAEFVAEVYAGRSAGIIYPDEVMDLYRSLRGPA